MENNDAFSLGKNYSEGYLKENKTNLNNKLKEKSQNKNETNFLLNNKPQKRKRDYSPLMDLENDDNEEINNEDDINNININNKNNNMKKSTNKRMKLPLRKLVERITLKDPEENDKNKKLNSNSNPNKNINKKKKKRGIKIFTDISISEVSNNLFKNYYPCLLPDYYTDQISNQIIENQIDKLMSNFIKEKSIEINNKKLKINQNMDYLREIAQKQGEWIEQNQFPDEQGDNIINNEEDEQGNKSYDSNSENNSKNSYPEDESIVEEEEQEQDFDDKYDYYDNNDY